MNIDRKLVAGAAALAFAVSVSGCAVDPNTGDFIQYEFGEASDQTFMAQVVDPDPQYEDLVPESSGDNASKAIDRYREGNVKEPKAQSVRSANTGSGN